MLKIPKGKKIVPMVLLEDIQKKLFLLIKINNKKRTKLKKWKISMCAPSMSAQDKGWYFTILNNELFKLIPPIEKWY